jgi:hypothetical protein
VYIAGNHSARGAFPIAVEYLSLLSYLGLKPRDLLFVCLSAISNSLQVRGFASVRASSDESIADDHRGLCDRDG